MKVKIPKTAKECIFSTPGFETQVERLERAQKQGLISRLFGVVKKTMVNTVDAMQHLAAGTAIDSVGKKYHVTPRAIRRHIGRQHPTFFADLDSRNKWREELRLATAAFDAHTAATTVLQEKGGTEEELDEAMKKLQYHEDRMLTAKMEFDMVEERLNSVLHA